MCLLICACPSNILARLMLLRNQQEHRHLLVLCKDCCTSIPLRGPPSLEGFRRRKSFINAKALQSFPQNNWRILGGGRPGGHPTPLRVKNQTKKNWFLEEKRKNCRNFTVAVSPLTPVLYTPVLQTARRAFKKFFPYYLRDQYVA